MKSRLHLLALLICLPLAQCDKARDIANKAKSAAGEKLAEAAGDSKSNEKETPVDPALQALVDQSPEGVLFRKDLPFPTNLEVRVRTLTALKKVRVFGQSALGAVGSQISGNHHTTLFIERVRGNARLTLEHETFTPTTGIEGVPPPKDAAAQPAPPPTSEPSPILSDAPRSTPIVFRFQGKGWKPDRSSDFKAATVAKALAPNFDSYLIDKAGAPRPLWFSPRRYKIGESLTLEGESLAILFDPGSTGKVTLTLEALEAVSGHPCACFKITGDYQSKGLIQHDGQKHDQDVSITGGKVWLSLIHPVVLREEIDTIQTIVSGGGGTSARLQGVFSLAITREWKSTTP